VDQLTMAAAGRGVPMDQLMRPATGIGSANVSGEQRVLILTVHNIFFLMNTALPFSFKEAILNLCF